MRRPRVVVHADARRELFEAAEYYDQRRDGYGPLFIDAVEREFQLLVEFPRIGKPAVLGTRRRTLRGWPYRSLAKARSLSTVTARALR